MNIDELGLYEEDFAIPLVELHKQTGNSLVSGYLGEKLNDAYFDSSGFFRFSTHKEMDDSVVDTKGIILSDSVLLSQIIKGHEDTSYRLYSWDVDDGCYTFLAFDKEFAMKRYFDVISRFNANLNRDDISSLFKEMGLTFDNVTQILLNQKINPMDMMFEEEMEESFTK